MNKALFAFALVFVAQAAKADHSLQSIQQGNSDIARIVKNLEKTKKVVCDTEASIQMSANVEGSGNTWRQVAFCFKNQTELTAGRQFLSQGGLKMGLGAYGLNAAAILDVSYTLSVETMKAELIDINLK